MKLYKLGEKPIYDVRKTHFGFRTKEVEIDTFSQVIQVIEFHKREWFESDKKRMRHYPGDADAKGIHLRLFRTVPKLDLETIFPNTTPLMRNLDKIKILRFHSRGKHRPTMLLLLPAPHQGQQSY